MSNKANFLKYLGSAAVVLSLAFVGKRLAGLDMDASIFLSAENLFHVAWISLLYGAVLLVSCVPWMTFIRIISGRSVPFAEAAWVMNKSNLLKYLPGNVFQFIGRNELAVRLNLRHADVAFATVCDVGLLVAAYIVSASLMNLRGVGQWLWRYGDSVFYFWGAALAAVVAGIVVLRALRKDVLLKLLPKLKVFLTPQSAKPVFACFLYYIFLALCSSLLFLAVLYKILHAGITRIALTSILSAYTFSWVAGFAVPGAPGGVGIREAALTLLLADIVPPGDTLMAAVIFRFISIIGDFCGFLFAWAVMKISRKAVKCT